MKEKKLNSKLIGNKAMVKRKLFNVQISTGSYREYIDLSASEKNGYSCFLNSHMLYEYYHQEGFRKVLDNANYVLPDGVPALYSLRFFGARRQERIAGNDVIFSLIDKAHAHNLKLFVIGTTGSVLKKISNKLAEQGVKHKTYSPPFRSIEEFDFEGQARMIKDFKADLVLVGLGCPKQELWMHRMKDRINASMYGLGGAFLLYAGVDSRAPLWMRKLALEWVYRLALEPRRLFKRYFVTNTYFCYLFLKELIKRRI